MRKTIRLNTASLERLADAENFNQTISDIVARYELIMSMTELPEFNSPELVALGELLIGSELTRSKVHGLYLDVMDLGPEFLSPEQRDALSEKVKGLTVAQIVKLKVQLEG